MFAVHLGDDVCNICIHQMIPASADSSRALHASNDVSFSKYNLLHFAACLPFATDIGFLLYCVLISD